MTLRDQPLPFELPAVKSDAFICTRCSLTTVLSEAGARSKGWRIFRGTNQAGGLMEDTLCPTCSGRGASLPVPTWDWRCLTCGEAFTDVYDPRTQAPLINAAEARLSASRHVCEREFTYHDPSRSRWVPEWDLERGDE